MVRLLSTLSLILLIVSSARLSADLVWSPSRGWYAEGGLLEDYLGDGSYGKTALAAMNEAREEQDKGNYKKALQLYKGITKNYGDSLMAPEATFQMGVIYKERKQWEKSFETLQKIINYYPEYEKFNNVIAAQFEIATALKDGARSRLFMTIPGLKNYSLGQELYEKIIKNAPYSEFAPLSLMNISTIAKKKGEKEEAIDALDRLVNNYPDSSLAPDAYYMLAEIYSSIVDGPAYDQGSTREAMSYYQDFLILYPNNPQVSLAESGLQEMTEINARSKLYIADFYYHKKNNPKAALVFYNETITVAPKSKAADRAREMAHRIRDELKIQDDGPAATISQPKDGLMKKILPSFMSR
jgi:outer membrane protein assembly factor BamD